MITKLKICFECNLLKHIWKSHGKNKYCKGCWNKIQPLKHINSISKKMNVINDEYNEKQTLFLIANPVCKAKLVGCTGLSCEVHHSKGRGENHLNISTWIAICRNCHLWCENNPIEAKELNLSESRLNK